jgi:hypothetical protein
MKDSVYLGNGHWRYSLAYPGVVDVTSENALPDSALKAELRKKSLEEGNRGGLIVSKFSDRDALELLRHPLAANISADYYSDESGTIYLPSPVTVERIDAKTGDVSPVRGLGFNSVDSKSLRMISAAGEKKYLHEPLAGFSVLCPALLLDLVDLQVLRETNPRLPYLR